MPSQDDIIIIGKFGAAFGIQGWIKVISFSQPSDNILSYNPWWIEQKQGWEAVEIEGAHLHSNSVVVKLPGCDDRDVARSYTNKQIGVEKSQLPALNPGQFYWRELEGLAVFNLKQEYLGVVDQLLDTGANDVLVVVAEGRKERLIPYIKDVVVQVDLTTKKIIVDWDSDF